MDTNELNKVEDLQDSSIVTREGDSEIVLTVDYPSF